MDSMIPPGGLFALQPRDAHRIHRPKPPSELYDPQRPVLRPLASASRMTYRDGRLLGAVRLVPIFLGRQWQLQDRGLAAYLHRFMAWLVTSPVLDQLAEYGTDEIAIGHGSTAVPVFLPEALPANLGDQAIRGLLEQAIASGVLPANTPDTLYVVCVQSGVRVQMGGSASCTTFCGYHDVIQGGDTDLCYAVIPFPNCTGCLGGLAVHDALTGVLTHEIAEAITDPVPGTGWYNTDVGEIGDVCAWKFREVAAPSAAPSTGFTVQLLWSNRHGACV